MRYSFYHPNIDQLFSIWLKGFIAASGSILVTMALVAPTHRHRSKSAPRARSPNPKELKRAAKLAKQQAKQALVTPPPKTKVKEDANRSGSTKPVRRKLSYGGVTTTSIVAENVAGPHKPGDDMKPKEVEKIMDKLKKEQEPHVVS